MKRSDSRRRPANRQQMTLAESMKFVKLIEFETYSLWAENRRKIFINPLQVTSLEQGNASNSTIINMFGGCQYSVAGDVTDIVIRLTEGGAA